MHILVQTPDHKHLVVVVNRVCSKELLWLLQRTVLPLDLIRFRVKAEAVWYPSLVTSKHQDLAVTQREAANRVAGCPLSILVYQVELLEFLLIQISVTIQFLESVQQRLSLTVPTSHHIQVPWINNAHRVEVTTVVHLTNFKPLILSDIVDFSLAWCVIRVLTSNCIDVVLGLVFKSSVEMGELVTTLAKLHWGSSLHLVSLFV